MKKLLSKIFVVLLISANSSAAQENKQEDYKISVDAALVATDITVIGKDVPQLSVKDFVVLDNGVEQEVSLFSRNQLPLAVALLIDTSWTVQDYLPLIQIASGAFLRNLDPEDQVALFSFDAEPRRLCDLTYDRVLIAQKISKFKFQFGTDLFGAIFYAGKYLQENAPNRRRAIIVISDNFHYGAEQYDIQGIGESQRARSKALEAAVTVYSIKTPSSDIDRTGSVPRMRQIADDTGGEILDLKNWTSLQATLFEVIMNLRMQYILGFHPTEIGESGNFHKLDIAFADKDRCPDCRLLTRSGYYAGISTPSPRKQNEPAMPQRSAEETDRFLIQQSIATAGSTNLDLSDLPFKASTTQITDSQGQPHVRVELNIDASRLQFSLIQNRYACKLHVTVFYTDKDGKMLGSDWKTIEGELKADTYLAALEKGLSYTVTIPVKTKKQMLSVVVYDEESDRVGTKLVKLP